MLIILQAKISELNNFFRLRELAIKDVSRVQIQYKRIQSPHFFFFLQKG